MPTYDYRCLECDERFERRSTPESADEAVCPQGHRQVKRLFSAFAVSRPGAGPAEAAGGCCGGACGCG